jgi:FkbM family methyltransferase
MPLGVRINQLLRPLGIFIGRRKAIDTQWIFSAHDSCQIPNLGFIYEKVFGQLASGYVVEVGAYDGIYLSNSSCLIEQGWRGLLVEPVEHLADACRKRYVSNPKVKVLQMAVGANQGHADLFYMDTMSSMSQELKAEYETKDWAKSSLRESRTIRVDVDSLDNILEREEVPSSFEVLIVDVEGMETAVFAGLTLNKWKPKMLIVELADFHPDLKTNQAESFQLGDDITKQGYRVIYKDHINTIFVRDAMFATQ